MKAVRCCAAILENDWISVRGLRRPSGAAGVFPQWHVFSRIADDRKAQPGISCQPRRTRSTSSDSRAHCWIIPDSKFVKCTTTFLLCNCRVLLSNKSLNFKLHQLLCIYIYILFSRDHTWFMTCTTMNRPLKCRFFPTTLHCWLRRDIYINVWTSRALSLNATVQQRYRPRGEQLSSFTEIALLFLHMNDPKWKKMLTEAFAATKGPRGPWFVFAFGSLFTPTRSAEVIEEAQNVVRTSHTYVGARVCLPHCKLIKCADFDFSTWRGGSDV